MSHRSVVVALALLALLAAPAGAQTPDTPRLAAAKELMRVAGVARQFDEIMPLLTRQLAQSFVAVAPDKGDEIRRPRLPRSKQGSRRITSSAFVVIRAIGSGS